MKILTPQEIRKLKSMDCYNIDVDFIESVADRLELDRPSGGTISPQGNIPLQDADTSFVCDRLHSLAENPRPEECKRLISDIIEFVTCENEDM